MERRKRRAMWRSISTQRCDDVSSDIRACSAGRPRRRGPCGPLSSAIFFVLALVGCSKPEAPAKPAAPTYTLREVTLPDLSHAVPTVQQQLRDGYATLKKKIDAPTTPADEL